jgi:GntR family transcriptional regulator, transcriptional repressor for pyruvate dehydrogenase complex
MAKGRVLLYETALEYIKSRIVDGTYAPGQQLSSVSALAAEVGVGISTVREAIRILESLGLLSVVQGRGIFVIADPGLAEDPLATLAVAENMNLLGLLETRKLFEPEVAGLAAERATPEEIATIRQAVQEHEYQMKRSSEAFIASDLRFHRLLLAAAHNPVLARMVQSIDGLLVDGRRRTAHMPTTYDKSLHYHWLIADAVAERDSRRARTLMLEHILDLTSEALRYLEEEATPLRAVPAEE